MSKRIYLCENSVEGIFTGIYNAWEDRHGHANNQLQIQSDCYNTELFCEYTEVKTDLGKAKKVSRTLAQKLQPNYYNMLLMASLSYDCNRAESIYRVVNLCIKYGNRAFEQLANPHVSCVDHLQKNVANELMHYRGFLRFEECKSGILFAKFRPKNDIIRYLGEHFCDRFPDEAFMIVDCRRNHVFTYANHKVNYTHYVDYDFDSFELEYAENENLYQELFAKLTKALTIKERRNDALQKQMLPLRFREFMPDFHTLS